VKILPFSWFTSSVCNLKLSLYPEALYWLEECCQAIFAAVISSQDSAHLAVVSLLFVHWRDFSFGGRKLPKLFSPPAGTEVGIAPRLLVIEQLVSAPLDALS
jgi:hypothetical protein